MTEDTVKTKRSTQTIPAIHIIKFKDDVGCTYQALADEFGVSDSSLARWVHENKAPKWTRIAIEGLTRRRKQQPRGYILVRVEHAAQVGQVEDVLSAMGCSTQILDFNGQV